jgi:hypothetical protein
VEQHWNISGIILSSTNFHPRRSRHSVGYGIYIASSPAR